MGGVVIIATSVDVEVLLAPPPDALAMLLKEALEFDATLTFKVIGLPDDWAAITLLLVHVTTRPTALQLQPVPVAEL